MREYVEIARDLLDQQLVDVNETRMGRADGIVMVVEEGKQPRIDHLELGFIVLARRLGRGPERWFAALRARWSVRKTALQVISWSKVLDFDDDKIKVDINALDTPAFDWEHWLRDKIIRRIPGAGGDDD